MPKYLRYTAQAGPGVAVIDIDRPTARNALDRVDQYHFDELLAAAVADPDVRCLVLAACADLRVAGPGTRFKVTAMSYGYPALSWILTDLPGTSRAKDVLFTGRAVAGQEGADVGLFNRLVPDAEVRAAALALAAQVAALPPGGVQGAKRLMREGAGRELRARYDAENTLIRGALAGQTAAELFAGFGPGKPRQPSQPDLPRRPNEPLQRDQPGRPGACGQPVTGRNSPP